MKNIQIMINGELVFEYNNDEIKRYSATEIKKLITQKFGILSNGGYYYRLNRLIADGYLVKNAGGYEIRKKF